MTAKIMALALACGCFAAVGLAADQNPQGPAKPADAEARETIPAGWQQFESVFIGKLEDIEYNNIIGPSNPPVRSAKLKITVEKVLRGKMVGGETISLSDSGRRVEPIGFPAGIRYLFGAKGNQLLKLEEIMPAADKTPANEVVGDAIARKLASTPELSLLNHTDLSRSELLRVTNAKWFKSLGGKDPGVCDFATHDLVIVQGSMQNAFADVRFTVDKLNVNFEVVKGKYGCELTFNSDQNKYRQAFLVKKDTVLTPVPVPEEQVDASRLFSAVAMSDGERVKALIAAGINLEAGGPESEGRALHWAAERQNFALVNILLEAGAKVDSTNNRGWQPLHQIAASCYGDNKRNADFVIKMLLGKGAKLDAADAEGYQPLHRAVWKGNIETVKLLLQAGASPDVKAKDGKTPLDLAREGGYYKRNIIPLLKKGAETEPDSNGLTQLHHLAKTAGRYEVEHFKELLASGLFKVDAADHAGNQPLHYAMSVPSVSPGYDYYGQLLCCKELIAAGASLNAKNKAGKTPPMLVVHQEVMGHLSNARQQELSKLTDAAAAGNIDVMKAALAKHGKWLLNLTDDKGATALHLAIAKGRGESVKFLLAEGASTKIGNAEEMLPLHLAVIGGQTETVQALLQAGASATAKTKDGKTPLDLAREHQHGAIIKLLEGE